MKTLQKMAMVAVVLLMPASAHADHSRHHCDNDGRYHGNSANYNYGNYSGYGYSNNPYYSNNYGYYPYPPRDYNRKPVNYLWQRNGGDYQINEGIRDGALSWREVRDLQNEHRALGQRETIYWADGYLSPAERESLHDSYHKFEHDLNHELNDGERRY